MTNLSSLYGGSPQTTNYGSFKNKIINGDFNISQRGTSFAAIADGAYNLDRYRYNKNGTMIHTVTQDTDVPTQTQSGHKSNYSLKMDCTTADAAVASSDFCAMQYKIEGYDFAPLVGKTCKLSFWVKSTKTGVFCISLNNGGGDDSYVTEYTVSSSDTWEKKAIEITFDYTGGTWYYTNGIGLNIYWWLTCGTAYHTTTTDSWLSAANKFATANQVNACDNVANNFILSQIQLEIGSGTTPFESRSIEQELALCQRYYEKSYHYDNEPGTVTNVSRLLAYWAVADSDANLLTEQFKVSKRATPTMTWYSPNSGNSGNLYYYQGATDKTVTNTTNQSTERTGVPSMNTSVPDQSAVGGHWTADAEL